MAERCTRDRLLSLGGGSELTWRSRGGTATTVPGFSSADSTLPAVRDPKQAYELLCSGSRSSSSSGSGHGSSSNSSSVSGSNSNSSSGSGSGSAAAAAAAGGVALRQWLRLAPTMGLADLVTAESTFQLLAKQEEGSTSSPSIRLTSLALYAARIEEKGAPAADHVSGWLHGESADSILEEAEPGLADGEVVLLSGGMPQFAVHDMNTTPRTNGSLILTTHAIYWRPSKLLKGKLKLRRCAV
jgi:hypothetical protein